MTTAARAARVLVLCSVVLFSPLYQGAPGVAPVAAAQIETAGQPPADEFDFPDEEEDVPTWADDLRAQALDLTLVSAFLVLAFVSFFR